MREERKTGPASWNAAKLVLAAGTPLQKIFFGKGETHIFCNRQAIEILRTDGKISNYHFLDKYLNEMNRGVIWADKGWKNFAHYLDPKDGQGFGPWPDAGTECCNFFENAVSSWLRQEKKRAAFFLGAAAHLVQDLCVPHHSRGIVFCGHNEYEIWVQENYKNYAVQSDGIYMNCLNAGEWVEHNARISWNYFPYISHIRSLSSYELVTKILLPLAQRSTAGFFLYFLNKVGFALNRKRENVE